jgi:hypothetical protein
MYNTPNWPPDFFLDTIEESGYHMMNVGRQGFSIAYEIDTEMETQVLK